ncbi:hypothetical protein LguiB_009692 [Lonicera macranthoides]
MQSEVVEEIISGLESGILFGIASRISKMGFISLEQGFSKLLVPICISLSACWSASGFVYQTRGLKHGRAIVTSTCAAMASILTGVLAGMLALGDRLPSAPMALLWLCSDGHLLIYYHRHDSIGEFSMVSDIPAMAVEAFGPNQC